MKVLLKDNTLIDDIIGIDLDTDREVLVAVTSKYEDVEIPFNKLQIVLDDDVGFATDIRIVPTTKGWKVIK